MSSNSVLARAGLAYLGAGGLLALYWHGFHFGLGAALVVIAWPAFVVVQIALGLINAVVLGVGLVVALAIAPVVYWEISQRRMLRRIGSRR